MGLDMYLYKETYVLNWDWMPDEAKFDVSVLQNGEPRPDIDPSKIAYISEQVAVWRKANHIHKWFVDKIQGGIDDCGRYYCGWGDLQLLLDTVYDVLEDPDKASDLLPTTSGFFFGETEYDDYYWNQTEYTKTVLEDLITLKNKMQEEGLHYIGDCYYVSSW